MLIPFEHGEGVLSNRRVEMRSLPASPRAVFIDNGKLNAGAVLAALGDALVARGMIGDYTIHKKLAVPPLSATEIAHLASDADIVVSGVGDCGGCSSTCTLDALKFLELGIPAFVVATRPFEYLIDTTDRHYGVAGLQRLFMQHPIWELGDEWFAANADRLAAEFADRLAEDPVDSSDPPAVNGTWEHAFDKLGDLLASDGFKLQVDRANDKYVFRVLYDGADCLDCLVPASVFVDIAVDAGRAAGLDMSPDAVVVEYPRSDAPR